MADQEIYSIFAMSSTMNSLISSPRMIIRICPCRFCRLKLMAFSLASFFSMGSVQADTPLGWINSANMAAYTTTRGEFEISLSGLAVNDTIDFLNVRDELIINNKTLVGDSGNLIGGKFELHYGITETLAVFYRQQQHSLTVDLAPSIRST